MKKGITLISLVITIIIMIILATVAINLAVDGNGLFRRAGDTANIWNNSVEQEGSTIQNLLDMADKIGGQTSNDGEASRPGEETQDTDAPTAPTGIEKIEETKTTEIISELPQGWNASSVTKVAKEKVTNITVKASGGTDATSEVAGYKYSIDNTNWTETVATSQSKELSDTNGITKIYVKTVDTAGNESEIYEKKVARTAPIPVGYVESKVTTEDEISEGLVIYEKTADITEVNSGNHTQALTSCNQFVWIPVDDIDYMVMCKSNNKLPEGEGNKTCDLEVVDGVLQCTNAAHASTKTELCGRVYATTQPSGSPVTVDEKKSYTYNMSFTADQRATQVWDTSSYREPDIVSIYDKDSNTSYLTAAGVSTASELSSQLTSDFVAMAESVEKYGGFYVSRYEAGENGASKKEQQVMVAGTRLATGYTSGTYIEEDNMWYGMYKKLRISEGINKEAVSSHMIWGCQYDMVISFLSEKASNDPFTGHTNRQLGEQGKTGTNSADVMSNVYDLEGNHRELTAQADSIGGRAYRGGDFYSVASFSLYYPASYRSSCLPYITYCIYGSRGTLYL